MPTGRAQRHRHDVRVSGTGKAASVLSTADVARAIGHVLKGEAVDTASVSVTFLTAQQMRALNRRTFDRDRATDVIAFPLRHAGMLVGDVYVCPAVARRTAREHGMSRREEELRLVVHGTLHAVGHEHPDGSERARSPMWRQQERYLAEVVRGGRP